VKYPYDTAYSPPAPSLEIHLGLPGESPRVGPLPAFVDTGADASIVPAGVLEALEARASDHLYVRGQWGDRRPVDVYLLSIAVGSARISPVQVIADEEGNEIVVGRNALNRLTLTLDGPGEELELRE
jgi:predicted aspartyl protease